MKAKEQLKKLPPQTKSDFVATLYTVYKKAEKTSSVSAVHSKLQCSLARTLFYLKS